nr:glycosyltransferase family 4 protein [uncultured Lacibacter sp.]
MADHLHIVSFDVPYPADYGGVVDVFYKIKALHELGMNIHLHCFEYGRGRQPELEKYCVEVHYYPRQEGHKGFSLQLPYIVASRNDAELWQRLNADNYPVLFEGVHSTFGLTSGAVTKKNIAIRLHNTEFEYYKQLGKWEVSLVRKAYMQHESRLLKRYEQQLKDYQLLAISPNDCVTYKKLFKASSIEHLPAFIPNSTVTSQPGKGTFALYHGNLSVAENEKTATWLLEKIFRDLDIPIVIAGKNPSVRLAELVQKQPSACLVANPSENELDDLMQKAQVHVLPSMMQSGIKLKLLNALFKGRHVIVNKEMIEGTGTEQACQQADNVKEMKYHIYRLFHKEFTEQDIQIRKELLQNLFNNKKNAEHLIRVLH